MDAIKFTCAKCAYQFVGTADNFQCPSCHKHSAYSGCLSCGTPIKSTPSRLRRYCCTRCFGDSKITLPTKDCPECGKPFRYSAHNDREHCSRECFVIARRKAATVSCLTCGNDVKSTPSHPSKYCSRACFSSAIRKIADANCLQCGTLFRPKGDVYKGEYYVQKYCSKACHAESRRLPPKPKPSINPLVSIEIRAIRSMAASVRQAAKRREKRVRSCVDCGVQEPRAKYGWHTGWRCRACSKAHTASLESRKKNRRAAKSRRKALERGASVGQSIDPIAVFERDKWRCHICGLKTKKSLRGTYEPLAPELDHITALADGGKHSWGNVACACRKCNNAKSSRSFGQQGLDFAVII